MIYVYIYINVTIAIVVLIKLMIMIESILLFITKKNEKKNKIKKPNQLE